VVGVVRGGRGPVAGGSSVIAAIAAGMANGRAEGSSRPDKMVASRVTTVRRRLAGEVAQQWVARNTTAA